ncbi:glycoside hydrolase family 95 protein [Dactylosporangium aurantiacum]|uniref:Glycoside hydrolase family 95 protein n=1 Tax=Dactylosporangium aurantiacum TaxID=35754 RepID=A0A9Q9MC81_9ACTN|nr:glycoside hydrolase family 95 protein [Dactylosporangium aurantiacum]MDG6107008.1 glycoside hydrolase family 95 protein [Dactylosporangium aurantiacum]UWZ50634.1 glycoside hydrolase family 95 protein [Dactylosporangium aurantiacum]
MTRHRIERTAPAADFPDGFPIGNGRLGAMLHGRPGAERIDLNADTLWSGGPLPDPPRDGAGQDDAVPARLLPALRAAVAAGDHAAADALARQLQGDAWTQSFQPIGHLEWRYADPDGVAGYRRHLDLADAVAVTGYDSACGPVRLTAFVSAPDDVLVVSATGPGSLASTAPPRLHSPHPVTAGVVDAGAGPCLLWTGRAPAHVLPDYVDREPAVVYATDTGAAVPAGMGFAVAAAVRQTPDETRLVVAVATGFRGHRHPPSADLAAIAGEALARVARALARPTRVLRQRHVADHRQYFDRADLHLPTDDRAELLFHLGRYLLIAASRPGTQPANLQGIWNADVRPGWSCNWTTNINAQMNYWAAESTGLADLHEPLLTLTADLAAAGTATAARHYAARGAAAHHNTDLWRFTAPVPGEPQWANWPSALPWLAAHVWDHLDHGGARAGFADDVALPVLRAATRFVLDMLVPDAGGALVVSPSTSPEHDFRYGGTGHAAVSWGSALDQELAREVLTRLLVLLDRAPDPALRREATAALAALRPVPTGPDGALLEWHDDHPPHEPGHRHLSHLYGLYPGTRITETGTPADHAAARAALRARLAHGTGHTAWSRTWVLCLAARLRDPGLAAESLAALTGGLCSASMLTLHPDAGRPGGWIFQIDGNLGAPAGITELLVQSHAGAVSLLPALPAAWDTGRVRGVRCRGGHRADVTWSGGQLDTARITAGTDGPLLVELPAPPGKVHTTGGAPVAVTAGAGAPAGRCRIRWDARAGAGYDLG